MENTEELNNVPSSVWMQLDDEKLNSINIEDGILPEDIEDMLKQTAMRTILYQISANYREELEGLLGKDNIDENGQPKALQEARIPFELYEFICKNIISHVPPIEIEITNEDEKDGIENLADINIKDSLDEEE
jgi:hypothetical protein